MLLQWLQLLRLLLFPRSSDGAAAERMSGRLPTQAGERAERPAGGRTGDSDRMSYDDTGAGGREETEEQAGGNRGESAGNEEEEEIANGRAGPLSKRKYLKTFLRSGLLYRSVRPCQVDLSFFFFSFSFFLFFPPIRPPTKSRRVFRPDTSNQSEVRNRRRASVISPIRNTFE